jgi:hypothetical protein
LTTPSSASDTRDTSIALAAWCQSSDAAASSTVRQISARRALLDRLQLGLGGRLDRLGLGLLDHVLERLHVLEPLDRRQRDLSGPVGDGDLAQRRLLGHPLDRL